jgi:hypothetical protein
VLWFSIADQRGTAQGWGAITHFVQLDKPERVARLILAMSLPKSEGESARTVPPKSVSWAFNVASARPALISLLNFSMIAMDVLWERRCRLL